MSPPKIKVSYTRPDGTTIEATGTIIDVKEAKEPWAEYHLDDGSIVRVKQTLLQAVRLDDEKAPNGDPVYNLQIQPAITIISNIEEE